MTIPDEKLSVVCASSLEPFQARRWTGSTISYIDVSAIDVEAKAIKSLNMIGLEQAPSRAKTVVRAGDILVSTVRPNLNAVAMVNPAQDGSVCSSAFTVLRCGPRLLPEYLLCAVQSPAFIQYLVSLAQGSHYPAVSDKHVLDARIAVPPIEVQAVIAGRVGKGLSLARDALGALAEQQELATVLSERTLAVAFPAIPIQVVGAKPPVPDWRVIRLTEVARLESGHTPSRRRPEWWGGDVPWLALPDIRKLHGLRALHTVENTNDAGLANSSARLLPVDTVCLCRDASIGFVTILGRAMATSQHFCNWVCDADRLDPEYLMYAFMASHDYLRELGSGSVLKTIYMPTIQCFHILAPGIVEQRRIAVLLRDRLRATATLLQRLRERQADIARLPPRLLAAAFAPLA